MEIRKSVNKNPSLTIINHRHSIMKSMASPLLLPAIRCRQRVISRTTRRRGSRCPRPQRWRSFAGARWAKRRTGWRRQSASEPEDREVGDGVDGFKEVFDGFWVLGWCVFFWNLNVLGGLKTGVSWGFGRFLIGFWQVFHGTWWVFNEVRTWLWDE